MSSESDHGGSPRQKLVEKDGGESKPSNSLTNFIQSEISILRERYLIATDCTLSDPVYEGMVRGMTKFFGSLEILIEILCL